MADIYSINFPLKEALPDLFKNTFRTIGEWAGRVVKQIQNLPRQMQNHPTTAFAVFLTANAIFLTVSNLFANYLADRAQNSRNANERKFNLLLIAGMMGGATLTFNVIISKMTQYPLSHVIKGAITAFAVAIRLLINTCYAEGPAEKVIRVRQQFITGFCHEVDGILSKDFGYVKLNEGQLLARKKFLEQMSQGVGVIEDQPDTCRAVCVSIQAAFENLLARKLKSGEIKDVGVLFLTPLPCTPLRNPLQTIDTSKEVTDWKKWTVDIRTQTVRNLRDAGAHLFIAYCEAEYQAHATKSEAAKVECENYALEREKHKSNMDDIPLSNPVSPELVGAIYVFSDQQGNTYTITTQGVQIQNHGETKKECWKKWFGAIKCNPQGDIHIQQMIDFINNNQNQQNKRELKFVEKQ
jgi:hypothetical protein